ncbi:putative ferric-chelate reductase 1 [Petromyzon marinus]|uniref:putative ferric-chelate reductase 1 n=1 Tax=Petromyzon marinus TaxID=7757 RepID=UPI003F714258
MMVMMVMMMVNVMVVVQGDDDIYRCVRFAGSVDIGSSYSSGRSYPPTTSTVGMSGAAWRVADGRLQCVFSRSVAPPAPGKADLDTALFIMLAHGRADSGLMLKHEQQPLVSRVAVRLTGTPTEVPGSRSPTIIKAHGALMMVAWLTCASVGIVLARFFKPLWPTHYIWGQKVWFQLHRSFMTTVVLCSLVAFTLPFVYRAGWSHGAHPIVGCLVVVLAVAQPLMALVRPHPGEPRRSLFNWTHWATGTAARTAAVAAMFLGVDMTSLDLPDAWDKLTLIGAVAWQVATELLLEAHAHRGCRAGSSVGMELRGVAGTVAGTVAKEQSERSGTGHTFKKTVLAVYVAGNLVFLIVYLVAIEQA